MVISNLLFFSCIRSEQADEHENKLPADTFQYQTEQFADIKILRYKIPGFEELSLKQKTLLYYLYEAAQAGYDIVWDQNYKNNLMIRRTLQQIVEMYNGDRTKPEFNNFLIYFKRVLVSNGIHHHYATDKLKPDFTEDYFIDLINNSPEAKFPTAGSETKSDFTRSILPLIFSPDIDAKRIVQDTKKDIVAASANNFYEGVTQKMVESYYNSITDRKDPKPISYGLNSKIINVNGKVTEKVWKVGGMYSKAIEKIVYWLEKATTVAENDLQLMALQKLIEYYKTGDLRTFDEYSILWLKDTLSTVDVVNGFIEVYGDPLGKKGSFQSMVSIRDFEASKRTQLISDNAQWFENHLPYDEAYKKKTAKGINAKAINVVTLAGDDYPTPPIGVNLPNADWIRAEYGSKSVTISNLVHSYNESSKTSGALEEFAYSKEEIERSKLYSTISGELHTDLHEIIGHGSGQLKKGVADPSETLKNYASPLEEARAELVGLYFLTDPKMVELGLMTTLDAGKAEYDSYIRNGLITQLVRIELGKDMEQAHMRARQLIAKWAYEKGKKDNVIEKKVKKGKTYFVINDYVKLRAIFGEMLKEVQRIKSEGDYNAGKSLIENYAVKIDYKLHKEVLERWKKLNIAPYGAFINPVLVPVYKGDKIIDVKVEYPKDFLQQGLDNIKKFSNLPLYN